ncbi:uncharacterized protein C15orf39 homolog isoform X2 [Hyperolius riggenbachi]|uniref:uncharacterized protein C15orf39 homolog isoform X2 n=1 Tax=Hyperolius riggenbachi TaxID=752182 RepID=UPI0035A3666F
MSGKRSSGSVDHMMNSKMPRTDVAPHHSMPCPEKIIHKDVQSYKNQMAYSVPNSEGQPSSSIPWSSATAYLQYAGKALNEHLQSGGISKCRRSDAERQTSALQLLENTSNDYLDHQHHPAHNYHRSASRSYPPIAVPRPVYRNPSCFTEPTYGSRDFQAMGVPVASQSLYPLAVDWNPSNQVAYSSAPLYMSGMKNAHPTRNGYLEITGSPSSHPQTLQEPNPIHRHRSEVNLVESSPSCSQQDVFTECPHSIAQHNMQLLYGEDSFHIGKRRHSAFSAPIQQHYKPNCYQGSPDGRAGHPYSKAYCSSAVTSYPQRSSPFPYGMHRSVSPQCIRGTNSCKGNMQKMHLGYVNTEPRLVTQIDERMQTSRAQVEQALQIASKLRTTSELQICQDQRNKDLWFATGQVNKGICINSSKVDRGSAQTSSSFYDNTVHGECFRERSSVLSTHQQKSGSTVLPSTSTQCVVSDEPGKENVLTSKLSLSPNTFHTLGRRGETDATFPESIHLNDCSPHQSTPTRPIKSTQTDHSVSRKADRHHEISNDNWTSKDKAATIQSTNCDVNVDGSKSPPMPVINDVFSLAPYRAYLEGKAPHPLAKHQESEVEKNVSTSLLSTEKTNQVGKEEFKLVNIAEVVKSKCHGSEKTQKVANAQTIETLHTSSSTNSADGEVLDLSLKKLPTSSPQKQGQVFPNSNESSPKSVAGSSASLVPDVMSKCQDSCLSDLSKMMSHPEKEISASRTTERTTCRSVESIPPQSSGRTTYLAQRSSTPTKKNTCQSQESCLPQVSETLPQHLQRDLSCQTAQSLAHPNLTTHSLHASKNSPSLHENFAYPDFKSLPYQFEEKSRSWMTKALPQQFQENDYAFKNSTSKAQKDCPSQAAEYRSHQLHERKSQKNKYLPLQVAEMQPHKFQESYSSQNTETSQAQLQKKHSSQVNHVAHHSHYSYMSQPLETNSTNCLRTYSREPTNISLLVNTTKTSNIFVPQNVLFTSSPIVFCPKNLNPSLHQHQSQSNEVNEGRARNSVDSHSDSWQSGSDNESSGFHSSKAFMIRKYKMMKFSSSGVEIQEANHNSDSRALSRKLTLPSDAAQSLPPSAPESSPTLGEANVSLASGGDFVPTGSGLQFSELHRSVRTAVTSSVARSSSSFLQDWLEKNKEEERNKSPVKTKGGSRPSDPSPDLPDRDIWREFDGVRLHLHKLLSQLETFMFTRSCPFPHVIRAGAIFIPIYLVKEVLFPELLATSVDRVLQKHKVELRPTTLSEERLLRETELKECPSRMLKLLALKQLPDVYPDLLHLFCGHTIKTQLDAAPVNPSIDWPSNKGCRFLYTIWAAYTQIAAQQKTLKK